MFGSDWPILLVLIAILLWVFPDGRLPPGRLRRVSVALIAGGLLVGLVGLAPGIVAVAGHDVHVEASGNLSAPSRAWAIAGYMTIIAVLASWLGWLVVQVPGYRRSSGERLCGSRRPVSAERLHRVLPPGDPLPAAGLGLRAARSVTT